MKLKEFQEIGKITDTMLGYEDHGILSFMIGIDFGGLHQGFGGYALDDKPREKNEDRVGTAFGTQCIIGILKAMGVGKWEDLVGKEVVATRDNDEWNSKIVEIQAPPYNAAGTKPFNIKELADKNKETVLACRVSTL